MEDEQPAAGAGAPEAKDKPEKKKSTAEKAAEDIAAAIAAARAKPVAAPKQALIDEAMEKSETAEMRRALGLDVPFDVRKLLTRGVIEKRGLKVGEDLYMDMHTLNKGEDILAERLVEINSGSMPLGKAYLECKTVAILAMAITRINKDRFPVPDQDPANRMDPGWKTDWELKQALMRSLLGMQSGDIDSLMLIYSDLDRMDVLIDEDAKKKSTEP